MVSISLFPKTGCCMVYCAECVFGKKVWEFHLPQVQLQIQLSLPGSQVMPVAWLMGFPKVSTPCCFLRSSGLKHHNAFFLRDYRKQIKTQNCFCLVLCLNYALPTLCTEAGDHSQSEICPSTLHLLGLHSRSLLRLCCREAKKNGSFLGQGYTRR